jgi:hypothetical protein
MAFLTINGLEVPARPGPTRGMLEIGSRRRAIDGSLRVHRLAVKWRAAFSTAPLSAADADAWEALLGGEGDRCGWLDALTSAKGVAPATTTAVPTATGGRFGGRVQVPVGEALSYRMKRAGRPASVSVWRLEAGAWRHYLERTDGAKWVSGVRDDAADTTWLGLTRPGDSVVLSAWAGAEEFSDLWMLPALMPGEWAAELAAGAESSDLPELRVEGEYVRSGGPLMAVGAVTDSALLSADMPGGWTHAARSLSVELEEV